ncbi:MAG TPA: S8 family serine peptidase [Acidimicrobiia bacterium]|nr:S8 family serine peptidase [Acidimicrobiia bacterium]
MPTNADNKAIRGVGWGDDEKDSKGRFLLVGLLLAMLLGLTPLAPVAGGDELPGSWIVRAVPGQVSSVGSLLAERGAGGITPLPIIDGFAVRMTSSTASLVGASTSVLSVTPDARIELSSWAGGNPSDEGSIARIVDQVIGADEFWAAGHTGQGVDVAVIDSGIAPVPGLNDPAKVVNGPDISFNALDPELVHLDLFGHGTHMASIIAGSDLPAGAQPSKNDYRSSYVGVAPNARLVNVKVADGRGLADVSQVIAAIDWTVRHRQDPAHDLDIRVLALAFGTDSLQDMSVDPLAYAVEQAWNAGIVVVASSGNDGTGEALRNPARHPSVIAVGAVDTRGTPATADDRSLPFSNCGVERTVDVVAPGKSVLGLRVPGSFVDYHNPSAVVQDRLFRGSGTSQAAAIVAGAAALILDQRPGLSPDQVKALLQDSAQPLRRVSAECQGAGMIDLSVALTMPTPDVAPSGPFSTGAGSLDAARGTHVLEHEGVPLQGELDIFGNTWNGAPSDEFFAGGSWSGLSWSGLSWSGLSWSGLSWSGLSWSGLSWSGLSWSGLSWSGLSWSGANWSGLSWSGLSWSGLSWSVTTWS